MKTILDPDFKYTPSHSTDLRKTFTRIRREQREAQAKSMPANVKALPSKEKKR